MTRTVSQLLSDHGKWLQNEEEGKRLVWDDLDDQEKSNLRGADLIGAGLSEADLSEAGLSGADLSQADLSQADLIGADLRGSDLREADLREADLRWANLRWANMREADLSQADLIGANLRGADLREADLSEADLRWANLSEADLSEADLSGAKRVDDIPIVENLDARILKLVESGEGSLEMSDWHTCGTTHCRAGWAIHLAGDDGYALEKRCGPSVAGALIYHASTGHVPDFYTTNERAIEDMRARAGK